MSQPDSIPQNRRVPDVTNELEAREFDPAAARQFSTIFLRPVMSPRRVYRGCGPAESARPRVYCARGSERAICFVTRANRMVPGGTDYDASLLKLRVATGLVATQKDSDIARDRVD